MMSEKAGERPKMHPDDAKRIKLRLDILENKIDRMIMDLIVNPRRDGPVIE